VYNKQFEAMVCGRPIIITKGIYAAEMTEKLNCGLTAEYNKESVKEAIIKLRDNSDLCEKFGRNAFNAAKKQYNWENEKKNLLKVYEEIK
jgi:glycosyltransferase involved in cell wall biosynthesis